MRFSALVDGLRGINIGALELAIRRRDQARPYVSSCVQQCDALLRRGLPTQDPVAFLRKHLRSDGSGDAHGSTCVLPARLHDGGGTRLDELVYLAATTAVLRPRKIFEIGTFKGRTTTVFALNAPGAEIITLDLPPDSDAGEGYIRSDADLVRNRNLAEFIVEYGVQPRCRQILGDSMHFDPRPHAASVDLAFIDGAHSYAYVKNDTEKAAVMMTPHGLVFWHDYGGKGQFRGITDYLHELHEHFPVYRISGTTLAWTTGENLRTLSGPNARS